MRHQPTSASCLLGSASLDARASLLFPASSEPASRAASEGTQALFYQQSKRGSIFLSSAAPSFSRLLLVSVIASDAADA